MSHPVDEKRIEKFREDRKLLNHLNDTDIGKRMQISKSNFSSYISGRIPITNNFLNRFYKAFGKEIEEQRKKQEHPLTNEPEIVYLTANELQKQVKLLHQKFDQVLKNQKTIASDLKRLEEKVDRLLTRGPK
ncbi:MAG: hypothetical protein JST68_17700 [Bacteroidetes bacterium]|nr:hypothetical protein [Bacteroidota bacterium]